MIQTRKTVGLAYGRDTVPIEVPASAVVLRAPAASAHPRPQEAVRRALASPIESSPLRDLVSPSATVAITISDSTRAVPNDIFLPVLLEELAAAGVSEDNVVIIIGTGMHRPSTDAEREALVGRDVLSRVEVIDHRADDPAGLVRVADDPPVRVNRRFVDADFRIVTGFIEPHFMAGYSGGRKGVCPALVDLETIQSFHGYETLSSPRARAGVLDANPCHEIALRVAKLVGVDFLLNVTTSHDHRISQVFCGDLEAAHAAGCAAVDATTAVEIDGRYDVVVTTGGGAPLDQNFYQTVKGIVMAAPAVRVGNGRNGVLAVLSHCSDGLGSAEYADILMRYGKDCTRFISDIASRPDRTEKDQWEHQMHCRVVERIGAENLWLFTDGVPAEQQKRLALVPFLGPGSAPERLQRAVDDVLRERPSASLAIIPDGPYTVVR